MPAVAVDEDAAITARIGPAHHVELVEELPTGHATPLALEVVSFVVDPPTGPHIEGAELPHAVPLALGAPLARASIASTSPAAPFSDPAEHLTALLDLAAARALLAIGERRGRGAATGRDGGEGSAEDPQPPDERPAESFPHAQQRLKARADAITARVIASLAAGLELPFVELVRELQLSALATQLLVATLAPRARAEIARLYRALAEPPGGALCDDVLLATLIAGDDARRRDQVYAELSAAGALVRHGLVIRDPQGGLHVDGALLARLRGQPHPRSPATTLRAADRALDELIVDRGALRALVLELAAPRDPDHPVRVVIRGRRGSGRHATIAALAVQVDRGIACIDATQLPSGRAGAQALRRELARAVIARAVPVISGLEADEAGPGALLVAQVLRAHPGPLVVRTSEGAAVPLAPGYVEVVLRPLTEDGRRHAFAASFERHAIPADPEELAARHALGPGAVERVALEARERFDEGDADPTAIVEATVRRQLAARAGSAVSRVKRLATWGELVLSDPTLDGLRELIARGRHGRSVSDARGQAGGDVGGAQGHAGDHGRGSAEALERRRTGARGVTAVFHGPPGTGKALAASVVARELGLALYRVALDELCAPSCARPAAVAIDELFDAAEDGRWMLLCEDTGWLAARDGVAGAPGAGEPGGGAARALRRRLERFEGVAIVTTRAAPEPAGAGWPRSAMRIGFGFPDEAQRARLWAAHLTSRPATAGELDLEALARRFPLSGGAIRASATRAAFLAAEDRSAVTQAHLERAALRQLAEYPAGAPG
ncbi:MAG TPA: AAA family ATPase [Kofleriaceae bacterium]|nr:AAA family ATPase [Kofleriaceae bacterium]